MRFSKGVNSSTLLRQLGARHILLKSNAFHTDLYHYKIIFFVTKVLLLEKIM